MGIKTIVPLCYALMLFHGRTFGSEPIPEEEKSKCPQCYHEYVKYSYQVFLSAGMRAALKKYSPTFRIFRMEDYAEELRLQPEPGWSSMSCYSAVFNDFNGDGRFDAAVLGEYSEKRLGENTSPDSAVPGEGARHFAVLAILSQGPTNYTVVEVTRPGTNKVVSTYLGLSRPGKISEIGTDGSEAFESKNYGISVSKGVGVVVFHWDDKVKRFREIVTGGM